MLHLVLELVRLSAVPLALAGALGDRARTDRRRVAAVLAVIVAVLGATLAASAVHNVRTLPPWDFLGFWLNAHVALAHHDVYDPRYARALVAPFAIPEEFRNEIVDAGFWYPPPSILVFLPAALSEHLAVAYALWYALQALVLVAALAVLVRAFAPRADAAAALGVAALVVAMPGSASTVAYGQTTFVLLLALGAFWTRRATAAGGAWLALAILVKPFAAVLALPLLLARRVRTLAGCAAALAFASLVTAWLLGPGTFAAFLRAGGSSRLPPWVYSEETNQSLLGAVLRATHAAPSVHGALANPLYLALALAFGAATLWLCVRRRNDEELALSLSLAFALLVYPVSQTFYALALVVPVLVLWNRRARLPYGATGVAVFATALYALAGVHGQTYVVAAYVLAWAALAFAALPAQRRSMVAAALARVDDVRAYVAAFALVVVVLLGHDVLRPGAPALAHAGLDFREFYCAGAVLDAGADAYRIEPLRTCEHRFQPAAGWDDALVVPSSLPPYANALFGILARLPYWLAKDVWYVMMLGALFVAAATLRARSGLPAYAVLLALVLVDFFLSFGYGQLPPFVVGALCAAAALGSAGRYRMAAVLAAVAGIEPHLALPAWLAMFVWWPRSRVALVACGAALIALSLGGAGLAANVEYVRTFLGSHARAELVANDQLSFTHLLYLMHVPASVALAVGTLSYIAMTVVGVWLAGRVARALDQPALVVLLPPAVALFGGPYVHDVQWAALLPPAIILAGRAVRMRAAAWVALALASCSWFEPIGRFGPLPSLEGIAALAAAVFAALATAGRPVAVRAAAAAAAAFAMVGCLAVLARLPGPSLAPASPLPAAAVAGDALSSENWAAYLRAVPALSVPNVQQEARKLPMELAVALLALAAAAQLVPRRAGSGRRISGPAVTFERGALSGESGP